jgi:hypothetical protein
MRFFRGAIAPFELGSSVSIVIRLRTGRQESAALIPDRGEDFLFMTASTRIMSPTQSPGYLDFFQQS